MEPDQRLMDVLHAGGCALGLADLDARGELAALIPELEAGRGFAQPDLHHYDVLGHNLAAVAAVEAATGKGEDGAELRAALSWIDVDEALQREIEGVPTWALLRLACLLHDVAKPATAVQLEGRLRFPRHGPRGAEMVAARLPALRFGPEATAFVAAMVRHHLRPRELVKAWPPTDHSVRRFVAGVDGYVLPLLLVNLADGMATRGPGYTRENFRRHCGFLGYVLERAFAAMGEGPAPLLSGDELMAELGLESGRLLGAVLTSVRRAQSEGAVGDRDEALALARTVLASLGAEPGR